MDYTILNILVSTEYFTLKQLYKFKLVSKTINNLYCNNYNIKKILSAECLVSSLLSIGNFEFIQIANSFYNNHEYLEVIKICSEILFNNIHPDRTVISCLDYKKDKFNPFNKTRYYRYEQLSKRIKSNINLQLALNHAEKPNNLNRIREIFI